jgi:hypothetical protein
MPQLWANSICSIPPAFDVFLERARALPLHFRISNHSGGPPECERLLDLALQHLDRAETLISGSGVGITREWGSILHERELPVLRELDVTGLGPQIFRTGHEIYAFNKTISLHAPNLVRAQIGHLQVSFTLAPCLRTLRLSQIGQRTIGTLFAMLRTGPRLEELSISLDEEDFYYRHGDIFGAADFDTDANEDAPAFISGAGAIFPDQQISPPFTLSFSHLRRVKICSRNGKLGTVPNCVPALIRFLSINSQHPLEWRLTFQISSMPRSTLTNDVLEALEEAHHSRMESTPWCDGLDLKFVPDDSDVFVSTLFSSRGGTSSARFELHAAPLISLFMQLERRARAGPASVSRILHLRLGARVRDTTTDAITVLLYALNSTVHTVHTACQDELAVEILCNKNSDRRTPLPLLAMLVFEVGSYGTPEMYTVRWARVCRIVRGRAEIGQPLSRVEISGEGIEVSARRREFVKITANAVRLLQDELGVEVIDKRSDGAVR